MPSIEEVIDKVRSYGHQIEDRDGIPTFIHPVGLNVKDMEEMLHSLGWNRSWGYIKPANSSCRKK